jgi:HlyD family secretion protein
MMKKKLLPWIIAGGLTIVLLGGGVWYYKTKTVTAAPASYITGQVKLGTIKKTVSATGTVQVPTQYNLSFSGIGKVTEINVKVSDQVKAGQILATQDQTDLQQKVTQAQDTLTQAELKLSQLKASPSEVSVIQAQNSVTRAQASVDSAKNTLQTLQSYKNTDTLQAAIDKASAAQKGNLQDYKDNPSTLDAAITQATNTYNGALGDLKLANAQLTQTSAGASSTDLKLAQNQVSQAKTALATAQSDLGNTTIKAPVDGTITAVNGQVGASPSGGGQSSSSTSGSSSSSGFVTLIGNADTMQIVVPVNQADIASIQAEQSVDVTLDAYADKHFTGSVSIVSPTGSTQSGVTTFSVTVNVPNTDNLMKPGMSASVSIIIAQKQNVLMVSSMAVRTKGSQQTVSMAPADTASQPEQREVKIGIDDGNNAEVISGLQEGDLIVIGTSARSSTTTQSSNRNSQSGLGSALGGSLSGGPTGGMPPGGMPRN